MNCIVNFTPTGMIPTREMTPHIPLSPTEIAENVLEAAEMGITMVHLHARDAETGAPTWSADVYAEIIGRIRRYDRDLVICVSLSGRTSFTFEERAEPLALDGELKPDMGSLTLSSLNFNRQASVNPPDMIQALAREMNERKIMPELEAFDLGMINYSGYLEKKGFLKRPHYFNLILGNVSCAQADLLHVGVMVRDLPQGSLWSLGGVGDFQLKMNSIGIASGGGVRVGLEDNVWYDSERKRFATNFDLLRRVHRIIEANERYVMKPRELRSLLRLEGGHGDYGRRD